MPMFVGSSVLPVERKNHPSTYYKRYNPFSQDRYSAPDSPIPFLVCNVGQQSHKPSAFDGNGNRMLTDCRTTTFSPAQNFTLSACQFFEQFNVFVIDEHRTWTLTIDHQWVFLRNLNSRFCLLSLLLFCFFVNWRHFAAIKTF